MTGELRSRAPGTADLPAIAALVRLAERADIGVDLRSEAHILSHTQADRFELGRDARLLLDADDTPVGFAWVFETLPGRELEGELYVHPDRRGRGLEARLLGWLEEQARRRLATLNAGVISLALSCPGEDDLQRRLLGEAGFTRMRRYQHMELDLTDGGDDVAPRPLPDGVALRDFRSPDDERPVYETLAQAFLEEYRYGEESFSAWRAHLAGRGDADPGLWVVAARRDEVVGAVIAFVEEGAGFVADVGVRQAWRRRGIGSALLIETFARVRRRGCPRVWLNVDAENPTGAVSVYEGVGLRAARHFDLFEKRYGGHRITVRETT